MKISRSLSLLLLLIGTACSTPEEPFTHPNASGHYSAQTESCVPYARKVSGLRLTGDAYTWWAEAAGKYKRGNTPRAGSVLVLKRTWHMRSGHVAVVRDVIDARQIHVTHSNWGDSRSTRHRIYDSMLVSDVSRANDWSEVRFWNYDKNSFGFPYAAYGFIYP